MIGLLGSSITRVDLAFLLPRDLSVNVRDELAMKGLTDVARSVEWPRIDRREMLDHP